VQGCYSYLNGNTKKFSFTDSTDRDEPHYFAIIPVDDDIAALKFYADDRFADSIPVPPGFSLTAASGLRRPFEDCYFLNWACSYKLRFAGSTVLLISHQKQQALTAKNGAAIRTCH
jgi:hypothetical protein